MNAEQSGRNGVAEQSGKRERAPRSRDLIHAVLIIGLVGAGCSAKFHRGKVDKTAYGIIAQKQKAAFKRTEAFSVERPAETLRRRLLLEQNLPFAGPASFGSAHLEPIPHWPEPRGKIATNASAGASEAGKALQLSLNDALQVAARNSRDYQSQKESVFRAALGLDLERDQFRTTFAGLVSGLFRHERSGLSAPGGKVNESVEAAATAGASQTLKSGGALSLQLGWNLLKLLEPGRFTSRTLFGDASVSIPLLRGAGRHIASESLTQADRDALYAIYEFDRFKGTFAVGVAAEYLAVLERSDQVKNAEENYRGLVASTRRARRLLDAGKLPPIQADQALQEELTARNRWISARESHTAALDSFKALLGLPPDAAVELDRAEFEKLAAATQRIVSQSTVAEAEKEVPPADAPIVLEEPSRENGGPFEIEPERAIRIALEHRLDLQIAEGRILDAQRKVVVAADRLRTELTFFGKARVEGDRLRDLRFDRGNYEAFLNLELPLERTSEAIAYRRSLLALEQAVRKVQALEDEIKLGARSQLRTLREARESLQIQALSVELARRRVRGADLNLQAGRVQIRDLLEAQEDLLSAQNAFIAAAVDYRLAELELQSDLGVLEVGAEGLWKEFNPTSTLEN